MFVDWNDTVTVGHLVTAVMFTHIFMWQCSASIVRAIELAADRAEDDS